MTTEHQAIPGHGAGQKPVHLLAPSGFRLPQDCVWQAIRALKVFSQADVELWLTKNKFSGINSNTVISYLKRLLKGGYLSVKNIKHLRGSAKRITYELEKDCGVHAPRLTKSGGICRKGRGRENLWRSMKILKGFNFRELARAASTSDVQVKEQEASDYIKYLHKAGYLHITEERRRLGYTSVPARYSLLPSRNTGHLPPMVQRIKQVFDPNLNQVVWTPEPAEVCDE